MHMRHMPCHVNVGVIAFVLEVPTALVLDILLLVLELLEALDSFKWFLNIFQVMQTCNKCQNEI